MEAIVTRKRKKTSHLVPIGTQIPMEMKLSIQAIAESQNKSVYEFLQDVLKVEVENYEELLVELKQKQDQVETQVEDESDLLG